MDSILVLNYEDNQFNPEDIQFNYDNKELVHQLTTAVSNASSAEEDNGWNSSPLSMPDSPKSQSSHVDLHVLTNNLNSLHAFSPLSTASSLHHSDISHSLSAPPLGMQLPHLNIPPQFFTQNPPASSSGFFSPVTALDVHQYPFNPLDINSLYINSLIDSSNAPKSAPPTDFRFIGHPDFAGQESHPSLQNFNSKKSNNTTEKQSKKKPQSKKEKDDFDDAAFTDGLDCEETDEIIHCPHANCDKTFNRQFNLKSHLRSHSLERTFTCDSCPASFRRSHDLKRHYRSLHTVLKPYGCSACGKRFARTDALKRHVSRPNTPCSIQKKE